MIIVFIRVICLRLSNAMCGSNFGGKIIAGVLQSVESTKILISFLID